VVYTFGWACALGEVSDMGFQVFSILYAHLVAFIPTKPFATDFALFVLDLYGLVYHHKIVGLAKPAS